MSHNIRYYTYGEKVDKKKVESDLSAFVAAEDWQEGCCGLPQPIRWLNVICNSQEEAEKYIEKTTDITMTASQLSSGKLPEII